MSSRIENRLAKRSYAFQRRFTTGLQGVLIRRLPRTLRKQLKLLFLLPLDGLDFVLGRHKDMVPPRRLNFAGDGDFEGAGDEFLQHFIDLGGLRPQDTVLDVGCGIGRMARPLTRYLAGGNYEGIDIVPQGILWCQRTISRRYPNFHFQLADVHNAMYNPRGRFRPSEYKFPFEDCKFHFTFLTSVFTHMVRRDMEHYLGQIARTLRPGGKCLITFFLLNDESCKLMKEGRSSLDFRFVRDGCCIDDEHLPEHAVAFKEESIRALYRELGFTVEGIRYGAWCGRPDYLSYQDIMVARKT